MKNYSKEIRKYFDFQIQFNIGQKKFNDLYFDNEKEISALLKMISNVLAKNYNNTRGISKPILDKINSMIMEMTFVVVQLYTDLYKLLNLWEKMEIIDETDEDILNDLRSVQDYNDILAILTSSKNLPTILESLGFNRLSVYDKVLQIKALDKKDIILLERFNPFFSDEYKVYNVAIDENFMVREIKKWQDIFSDDIDKSYSDAASFLEKYSIINDSLLNNLMEKYPNFQDFSIEKILRNFYQDRL